MSIYVVEEARGRPEIMKTAEKYLEWACPRRAPVRPRGSSPTRGGTGAAAARKTGGSPGRSQWSLVQNQSDRLLRHQHNAADDLASLERAQRAVDLRQRLTGDLDRLQAAGLRQPHQLLQF